MASRWNLPIYHGYRLDDAFENDFDIFMKQSLDEDTPHAFLEGHKGHSGVTRWRSGADGFKHERHQKNGARRILNTGEYSPKMVKIFQEKYNQYFYALTGKHIDFKITPSSQRYISMLEACRIRDKVLMTLFEDRPIIWDLMGGSGSDTIAFLFDLHPKKVIIVETANGGETPDAQNHEFDTLQHNIKSFQDQFPALNHIPVQCFKTECKNFIESPGYAIHRDPRVHLVYLDPSWDYDDENPESSFEMTPASLFKNLERTVWGPMKNANIKVDCYVLKTRWSWTKVAPYLEGLSSDYHAVYSIRAQPFRDHVDERTAGEWGDVKGVYHYMVLVHSDYKEIVANRSSWYMDLIRNGQRVYVDRRTTVKPFKPRYGDNLEFPLTYEKPNQYTFTVTPPDVKPGDIEPEPEVISDPFPGRDVEPEPEVILDPSRDDIIDQPRHAPAKTHSQENKKKNVPKTVDPRHFNPYDVLPEETQSRLKNRSHVVSSTRL